MVRVKVTSNAQAISTKHNPVKQYEEIAEGMETTFTSHMLAEMRKTIPKESPESSSMNYYNSLLDSERAQLMAKSESGLGVKKVILDQIVPQHMKHYLKNAHPEVRKEYVPTSTKENSNE